MGRRIRSLSGVDRAEFDEEPVGLQRHGSHHFNRRLFAVHLFHSTESGVKAIANTQRSLTTLTEPRSERPKIANRMKFRASIFALGTDRAEWQPLMNAVF
jgi:hypothetical protein